MTLPFTPYSTLKPMMPATLPSWIPNELDKQRIVSYDLYERIYWGVPETFKLVARGTEDKPIYLPSAKTIVETANRYTATGMTVNVSLDPLAPATDADRVAYQAVWDNMFKRIRFWSKFAGNKRYGLIRGDWLWYLVADPLKPEGSRIDIRPLDPASYFPITAEDDVDRIIGCHIVDQITYGENDDVVIHKTTYIKPGNPRNVGQYITVEEGIYELDDWGGPKPKPIKQLRPITVIPGITNLPVYHIQNFDEPSNPFGSSEIRGIERICAALNQAVSDQELALALEGLGIYWTDAPAPTSDDAPNVKIPWNLGPGRVLEVPAGSTFNRTSGVSSVTSSLDHMRFLTQNMRESAAVPDVAIGNIDVSIAQSGIALALQFAPIIAHTAEKDVSIVEIHSQMFYDIKNEWLPVFERISQEGVVVMPVVGDKIPVNREAKIAELNDMLDRLVITTEYYRQEMTKLGYQFPDGIGDAINAETQARAEAADPFGARSADELNGGVDNGEGQTQ